MAEIQIDQRLRELNDAWKQQYGLLCKIEGRIDELMYLAQLIQADAGEATEPPPTQEVSDDDNSSVVS